MLVPFESTYNLFEESQKRQINNAWIACHVNTNSIFLLQQVLGSLIHHRL